MISRKDAIEKIRTEAELLEISTREFIETKLGIGKSTFYDWGQKGRNAYIEYFEEDEFINEIVEDVEVKELEGKSERKPKIVEIHDGLYQVNYHGGKKSVTVSEKILQLMRRDYTLKHYGIERMAVKYDFSREEFFAIKTAFDFTHASMPYTDQEVAQNSTENLVEKTLLNKKRDYFRILEEKEIAEMKSDLKRYKTKEFWMEKVLKETQDIKIDVRNLREQTFEEQTEATLFVPLADIHAGLTINTEWNNYNLGVMSKRFGELTYFIESVDRNYGAKEVVVACLGDVMHGLIHASTRLNSADSISSFKELISALTSFLESLKTRFRKVSFVNIIGNHDSLVSEKTARTSEDNFGQLITWMLERVCDDINFIDPDTTGRIARLKIRNSNLVCVHGDEGGDLETKVAKMFPNTDYVFSAHLHNFRVNGSWHQQPSFCGPDQYALSKLYSAPAQVNVYSFDDKGISGIFPLIFS